MLGEFPQAPGDLHDDPTHSDNDRSHCQGDGRITLGAGPGDKTDRSGAVQ